MRVLIDAETFFITFSQIHISRRVISKNIFVNGKKNVSYTKSHVEWELKFIYYFKILYSTDTGKNISKFYVQQQILIG